MRGLLHPFPRQRLVVFVCSCLLPLLFFLGLPLFRFYDFDVQWKSQDGSNASDLIELCATGSFMDMVHQQYDTYAVHFHAC